MEELHKRIALVWKGAINEAGVIEDSTVWDNLTEIKKVLKPFMGSPLNHAHLPTGGGLDFLSVEDSREKDCLEVKTSERSISVFKVQKLTFEYFPDRPQESFFLLELAPLSASGVYESIANGYEELLDVPGVGYLERSIWDQGYLHYDDKGQEVPIPKEANLVSRWLKGKILIVAKGSFWNSTPYTYGGMHNEMSACDIRQGIEKVIKEID